jgi:hypothetical protein
METRPGIERAGGPLLYQAVRRISVEFEDAHSRDRVWREFTLRADRLD